MSRWANPLVKGLLAMLRQHKLRPKETVKFIGEDKLGNKYFEADRPANQFRRASRFFEAPKVENFDDVVNAAHVPPAWDAWLRFRRKEPPTEEELKDSAEYFEYQQQLAAERKEKEPPAQAQPDNFAGRGRVKKTVPDGHFDR